MSGSPPISWQWTWCWLWRERQNPKLIPHSKVIPSWPQTLFTHRRRDSA